MLILLNPSHFSQHVFERVCTFVWQQRDRCVERNHNAKTQLPNHDKYRMLAAINPSKSNLDFGKYRAFVYHAVFAPLLLIIGLN